MKIPRLFLLLTLFSLRLFSQSDLIIGNVTNDNGDKLPGATVYNTRTDQMVLTDKMGNFSIPAKVFDELRLARQGYERQVITLSTGDFSKSMNVRLLSIPIEIEALTLKFHPTGNLKKDVPRLNPPAREVALNNSMNSYMRTPMHQMVPTASVPSAFKQPNPNAGVVPLLSVGSGGVGGGLLSMLGSAILGNKSGSKTKADYAETQDFYRRVKAVIDISFYTNHGMDDYDIDVFLAYADKVYDLAKNYRNNFNKAAIELKLKIAFTEYLKNHSFTKKSVEG